jgi:hypothetical protein
MAQRTAVGNRDWNRIEAGFPRNRGPGRRPLAVQDRKGPKVSNTDTESLLKHIEQALQEDDDTV